MIVRIWRSDIDSSRSNEYERFETESLHMWARQPGFNAVQFLRSGSNSAVTMTFWEDQKAADALMDSPSHKEQMKKLEDSGMLRGSQTLELLEVKGGYSPKQPPASEIFKISQEPYFNARPQ